MMNTLFTDYAKSLYDDNTELDAKSMVKVLHILLHTSSVEEVSIKQLDRMYQLNVDDRLLFSKRFDFVDLTNRRVYEFDGDHHFKLIEHFHETYDNFVKGRSHDMMKQKFIVENGFDLVRITGHLTVHQFIDILVRLNLQVGQSLFIKDDVYQAVNTRDLSCELDVVEMLQVENARLVKEIQELKSRRDNDDDEEEIKNKVDDRDESVLLYFVDEISDKFYHLRYVSDEYLYIEYVKWHRINVTGSPMSKINFKRELEPLMNDIDYRLVTKIDENLKTHKARRNFNAKSNNYDDCYAYLLSFDGKNQPDLHTNSTYYEFTGNYFKVEEFIDIARQIVEDQKFSYEDNRQQHICDILCKMHNFDMR